MALLALALGGCDLLPNFSAESKINAAIPIAQQVLFAKAEVVEQVGPERQKSIEHEYANKLKLRALNCAKGYSPSWYTSSDEIRKNLSNHSCFVAEDSEIAKWLGLIRVGLYLAKPALVPIPATVPNYILADGFIQSARFSEASGIALVENQKNIEIIDLTSGKQLFQEDKSQGTLGKP